MKWTYVCKAEEAGEKNWRVSLEARPYVNDLLLFLGFALVFYGGGLLGGFAYFLGDLDFTQKSNRRIFLALVLAWYIPIFISQVYKRLGRQRFDFQLLDGTWRLNEAEVLTGAVLRLRQGQDQVHGNDVDQIWLDWQGKSLMVYQSVNLAYVQKLYTTWAEAMGQVETQA